MKIDELFIGAWVQELSPIVQRMTPPMRVTGIFMEDTAYLELEDHEGDPFECKVADLRGIPVTEGLLERNGFTTTEYFLPAYRLYEERNNGQEKTELTVVFRDGGLATLDARRIMKGDAGRVYHTVWHNPLCVHHLQQAARMAGLERRFVL